MAALGVVAFRSSKVHVLQESINSDNVIKADNKDKKKKVVDEPQQRKKVSKPKDAKANPPPTAVARRNARERNRVKQVNNGFATLRQHIPNEIAEIYENANNNRASNKKLSKVETLRMAVEYIRSLENLLSFNENGDSKENTSISLASFPSPASSESLQNGSSLEQSYFSLQSPMIEDDDSNPPTPLPPVSTHHYSRIPGTNAFQLIPGPPPPPSYEDEENVHPLTPNSDMIPQEELIMAPNMINPNMEYVPSQNFALVSPNFYSENSSSPNENTVQGQIYYQTIYTQALSTSLPVERLPKLVMKMDRNGGVTVPVEDLLQGRVIFGNVDDEMKQEPDELDGSFHHDIDTDENVDDMINWWETEGSREEHT